MNANLNANFLHAVDQAQRQGLILTRQMMRRALAGRDRAAPDMAETKDIKIPGPGGELDARAYRPLGAAPGGPALVFFHGGGFVLGDLDTNDAFVRRLASAARTVIIAVQYRLMPDVVWPGPLDDALAAARWVRANAAALEVNEDRIALSGDSAGAYLAIAATGELNRETPGAICAQVLIYPLLHIDDAIWKTTLLQDSRILGRAAVAYIRAQCAGSEVKFASLLDQDLPKAPPTLIVTGGALDPIRPDARAYADKLRNAGVEVTTREYPPLPHGFGNMAHLFPGSRAALAETGALAGRILRG